MIGIRAYALGAVFLASCATAPFESGVADAPALPFDVSARVFVSYGGRAFSSAMRWQHEAGRDEIWLSGPLGQTLAHIVRDGDGALLTGADQRQYRATSIESITRQSLGWEMPVAYLKHWMRGHMAPGSAPGTLVRDHDQRIVELEQGGWRILLSYYPRLEYEGLPRRLELVGGAGGTHQIRLVIDAWRGLPSAQ